LVTRNYALECKLRMKGRQFWNSVRKSPLERGSIAGGRSQKEKRHEKSV
jgi:hypothetical protein